MLFKNSWMNLMVKQKIWVHKGIKFYDRSMKSNYIEKKIEMNSTNTNGKSAVAERFIRTLKCKI